MIRSLLVFFILAACSFASSTASWEMNTFADFIKGRFSGLSLTRDGRMMLAPRLDMLFASDQPSMWSVAQAPDGSLYVGSGHRGRLYKVHPGGKTELVWTADQPEIFAVAVASDGAVYAGTSPDGKVYRLQGGAATEYFDPKSRYIWALAFDRDGALYVGTGDNGKIFRVTGAGAGEVYYETGQAHVTCLATDNAGRLLAGSEPNGLLYRIESKDKAFVLYDANLPEIRTVTVAPDGTIYAAALGGSVAQRAAAAANAAQGTGAATPGVTPTTTITVTDDGGNAQGGLEIKPKTPESAKQTATATSTIQPGTVVYTAPAGEVAGVEKSAVYRINSDHSVETLWTSNDENAYDLLLSGRDVVFSTDAQGRIYRVGADRRLTLVVQTNEGETTRLLPSGDTVVAATGSAGKLFRLGAGPAPEGTYESPVHDAGSVARWGQLNWRGERKSNGKLAFRTRSGNSARPDKTWSDWSAPLSDPDRSGITSPNARFVQWRAEFAGDGAQSPTLTGVTVSYLPQNNPPSIRSVNVSTLVVPSGTNRNASTGTASTYSITVTDSADAGASTVTGTPTQTVSRGIAQQIQITWQADDPDGDRLLYAVYYRGEDETQWKMLRTNFAETTINLEGDVLADGKYFFRVIASDKPSNSGPTARNTEMTSAPVLFDNTPPVVRATARRNGAAVEISAEAADSTSALRRAEYSLNATAWAPLESADGVVDGREEKFTLRLDSLPPGEHVIVVRAFDASNNAGLAKVLVQ